MFGTTAPTFALPIGLPRHSAAQAVLKCFHSDNAKHVHLHAPPGYGKGSVVHALLRGWPGPEGSAIYVDLSELEWASEHPVALIAVKLERLPNAPPDKQEPARLNGMILISNVLANWPCNPAQCILNRRISA